MRMATGRTWRDGRGDGRKGARMKGRERARVRGLNRIPTTGHRLGSRVVWGRLLVRLFWLTLLIALGAATLVWLWPPAADGSAWIWFK